MTNAIKWRIQAGAMLAAALVLFRITACDFSAREASLAAEPARSESESLPAETVGEDPQPEEAQLPAAELQPTAAQTEPQLVAPEPTPLTAPGGTDANQTGPERASALPNTEADDHAAKPRPLNRANPKLVAAQRTPGAEREGRYVLTDFGGRR